MKIGKPIILFHLMAVILLSTGLAHGQQEQGWMGVVIQNIPPALSDRYRLSQGKGALIIDVVRNQPADKAGVRRGDAIVEVNGEKVDNVTDLQKVISRLSVGDLAKVKVVRGGEFQTFDLRMAPADRSFRAVRLGRSQLFFWLVITAVIIFSSYAYALVRSLTRRRRRAREAAERPGRLRPAFSMRMFVIAAAAVLLLATLFTSVKLIQAGNRGVVFNLFTGLKDEVLDEGLHILTPFVNKVSVYNVRTQTYTMVKNPRKDSSVNESGLLWAPTSDGLKVGMEMTIRFKPDPSRLVELHRNIGPAYVFKILQPAIRNVARMTVSSYHIEDVYYTRRLEIQERIKDLLGGMLAADGVLLEEVLVRDVVYGPDFEKAIERKMVAGQKAEELSYFVEQTQKVAEAAVKEAQGEAAAFNRVSEQIKENPAILEYLWINELPKGTPILVVPPKK